MVQGEISIPLTSTGVEMDRKTFSINLRTVNGLLFVAFTVVFAWYLLSSVALASRGGVDLKNLRVKDVSLGEANSQLESKSNNLSSLNNLQVKINALGMVPADSIRYLYRNGKPIAKQ